MRKLKHHVATPIINDSHEEPAQYYVGNQLMVMRSLAEAEKQ